MKKLNVNNYLKKAFESLTSEDILSLINLLINEKKRAYSDMRNDIDKDWYIEHSLNELENKLRILYGNLLLKEKK